MPAPSNIINVMPRLNLYHQALCVAFPLLFRFLCMGCACCRLVFSRPQRFRLGEHTTLCGEGTLLLGLGMAGKRARTLWESSDGAGSEVCPLTSKFPRVTPTGSAAGDRERELKRSAFIGVIECPWKSEQDVYACRSFLEERQAAREMLNDGGDLFKPKFFSTVGNLEETFVVHILLKETMMSMHVLEQAKRFDENSPMQLLCYIAGVGPGMKLPEELRSRTVCEWFLNHRIGAMGRAKLLNDRIVLACGRIDWAAMGAYGFRWSDDGTRVIAITHRCSGTTIQVPEHVKLGREYFIIGNHLDLSAKVTNGLVPPNEYVLANFFSKQQGPHTMDFFLVKNKAVVELANGAQNAIVELRRQGTSDACTAEAPFQMLKKEKAAQGAGAARKALANKKADLNNRRRIPIEMPSSNAAPAPLAAPQQLGAAGAPPDAAPIVEGVAMD